jgi:hypothetical protein
MYTDVRSMFAYGFATKAAPDATVLGAVSAPKTSPAPSPAAQAAHGSGLATKRRGSQASGSSPIVERLMAAPVPALATAAIALLVIGVMVTALSRSQHR